MEKISDLFNVKGYGVVVTGGASGIGLGYAEAMAANGASVTLLDIHSDRIEKEVERLKKAGLDARGAVVDVTDHKALDAAIDDAAKIYGKLDVVFANAGIDPGVGFVGAWAGSDRPRITEGMIENYTDERWSKVIDINLTGVFATVRAAARHMRPRKSGRIIVTTSLANVRVEPAIGAAYMAAKAGAAIFTRNMALELAAYGINVNAISPGFIITNIGDGHSLDPNKQKAVSKMVPMHRVGWPRDFYGIALFLASHASDYITGQEIIVDGGWGLGFAD